ncbi:MAG: DUF11 domain-containing protein [Thermoanaerobaculia bacterium]
MKAILPPLLRSLVVVSTLAGASLQAQVDVTANAGNPGPVTYPTLQLAFAAVNNGTHKGDVVMEITGDITETATAVLHGSGTGAANYDSLAVIPSGGATRTISGAMADGTPLIDLDGADFVAIDGLDVNGNALTISNTNLSAVAGTSTIRFTGDATGSIVTHVTVLGSSAVTTTTGGGTIYFATGIATGNDDNTISNCRIGPAGANLPAKAISSLGSTATTTLYNSGIEVSNNQIYDYWSASAASHGIYLGDGTTDWTISANRFFQTGTRIQNSAAAHSAIEVASAIGNNNHVISANVIGYASAAGTGTYAFVGAGSGSKFLPIRFSAAGTTVPSSVQGNLITAISLSGAVGGSGVTGAFVGISVSAGNVAIGNLAGNTIGSATSAGAISVTSSNSSPMEVYGIYFFPNFAPNISNNTVAGITSGNSGSGSLAVYGIRASTTTSVVNTLQNNVVGTAAGPISNSSTSASSRIVGLYSQTGGAAVSGNTISHLSMNAANVGTGISAGVIGIFVSATSGSGNNVGPNTISHLANSHANAAVWVTGLEYNGSTTGTQFVQRNFIHALSTASTSSAATISGIHLQAGTTTVQNNMIALGGDLTADSPQINGIHETITGSGVVNFFHNSVYVGGAGVAGGAGNSFALQSALVTNTRSFRDNIFFNARSNLAAGTATGKHYAIRVGGTAANPAGLTSNNNVLLANGSGGVTGLFNAVDRATLAHWQAATGQDAASFADNPQFLAPAAATPDLHIAPAVGTPIEGSGFLIGTVTDDFDGQGRAGLTPVDIGADAGNFLAGESTPPTIAFTPLVHTSSTASRTLATTITDSSGVPTAGAGLPRIYYRKLLSDPFVGNACSFASGATYNCVLDYALLPGGGVSAGDLVQYYVAAQDTPGNVTVSPVAGAGGFTANPPAAATPPTTPASYLIAVPLSGALTVGSGGGYSSLTNPGGLFQAINSNVLAGSVVVDIVSDLAGETGAVALDPWIEEGAGGYTLTLRPAGAPRTITGDSTTAGAVRALIRLNGADRVTVDGSTSGGADRSLTITNADASAASAVIFVSSGSGAVPGATNDTLKNLVVVGSGSAQTQHGVGFGGANVDTPGTDNDNNRVENCDIRKVQIGIATRGASVGNKNTGTVLTRNLLNHSGANSLGRGGILAGFEDGLLVSENAIGGIVSSGTTDLFGISLGGLTAWSNATTSGGSEVSNATVIRNAIGTVQQTNGLSAAGIVLAPATTGATLIANNFVSGVLANGTAGEFGAGIFLIDSGTDSTTRIYANSVAMTGTLAGGDQGQFALAVNGGNPLLDLRDNILLDTQTTGAANLSYAIGLGYVTFTNLTSNWNDLFVPATGNFRVGRTGALAPAGGADQATLAAWQSATGKDGASIAADPLFVSTTDLHLTTASPVLDAGTVLAAVTVDFDGQPRPAATPDIGADEIVQADLAITKTDGVDNAIPGGSVTYTIVATNAGAHDAPGATVADIFAAVLTCSTTCVGAGGGTCAGGPFATNINDSVNLPAGASVTYTAVCSVSGSASGTLTNTATVTAPGGAPDPNAANNSATDIDTVGAAPTADVAITKTDGSATEIPGTSVTYTIVASNAGPSAAPTVTVTDTFAASLSGCSTTCVAAGGAACAAGPIPGNLSTNANLPVGGSATYTATCTISLAATGTLVNTATATVGGGISDPAPGNNSATDTDTLLSLTIFVDGFESGSTGQWSASVPMTFEVYRTLAVGASASESIFVYDFAALRPGEALLPAAIAFATDATGKPLLAILVRRSVPDATLEWTLELMGAGQSSWVPVSEALQQVRIEWSAADPGHAGHVAVALDGRLALWVEGFPPAAAPNATLLLRPRSPAGE